MIRDVAELVRSGRSLEACGGLDLGLLHLQAPEVDHVGVAVRDLEASRRACEALGLPVTRVETILSEGVRVGIVPVGPARIELLEGLAEETVVSRFVSRHGEGVHHIAFRVHGIDSLFKTLTEEGLRLASTEVRVGAGGHRYFFVHPESAGGTLVELVEEDREGISL